MFRTFRNALRKLVGLPVSAVTVVINGVPAIIDPNDIDPKKWRERVNAKIFVGHEEQSICWAEVGDSIVLRNPVDSSFFAMTKREFEATSYMFLMMQSYSLKPPVPHRQSDRC